MSLAVTIIDRETGDREEVTVPDGEYFLLCTAPCYVSYTQAFANGTHVLTIKGRTARPVTEPGAS